MRLTRNRLRTIIKEAIEQEVASMGSPQVEGTLVIKPISMSGSPNQGTVTFDFSDVIVNGQRLGFDHRIVPGWGSDLHKWQRQGPVGYMIVPEIQSFNEYGSGNKRNYLSAWAEAIESLTGSDPRESGFMGGGNKLGSAISDAEESGALRIIVNE